MRSGSKTCFLVALVFLVAVDAGAAEGFTIKGSVVDQAEKAVSGATVWCVRDHEVRKSETDASGAFSIGEVEVGLVSIIVRKDGYSLGGVTRVFAEPASVTIRLFEPAVLGLRIIDQTFEPIPGARIKEMTVQDEFLVPVEDLVEQGFPGIRSGDDGRLAIGDLPQGGYLGFRVSHKDYADTMIPFLPVDQVKQSIQLSPGETLRGRVTSEDGSGVNRAYVSLFRWNENGLRVFAETTTDPEGYYSMVAGFGHYLVVAKHRDFASPLPKQVELGGGTSGSAQTNAAAASVGPSSSSDLPPRGGTYAETGVVADLVLPAPRFVEGSVLGPESRPAPGVWVGYVLEQGLYEETLTTTDGTFRLKVAARDAAGAAMQGDVLVTPPVGLMVAGPGRVPVKWGDAQTAKVDPFRLRPLPVIEGTVFAPGTPAGTPGTANVTPNSNSALPEPNVLISSMNLRPPVWAITDQKGQFQVQLAQAPLGGKARFRAEHGLRFLRSEFEVAVGGADAGAEDASGPVKTALQPFDPDTADRSDTAGRPANDLGDLVGKEAPDIACDAWFNLSTNLSPTAPGPEGDNGGDDHGRSAESLSLKDLRGKVVVLTFWNGDPDVGAGNAGAVHDRIEEMRALHDLFRFCQAASPGDMVIVGIHDNMGSPEEVDQYLKDYRITFPVGRDTDASDTFQRYKILTIPETVLIDRKGIVRYYSVPGRHLELIKDLRRSP